MSADQSRDAGDFILFCDGLEAGGQAEYARRGRVIARHLLETLDELVAERSARVALQERLTRTEKTLLSRKTRDETVPF